MASFADILSRLGAIAWTADASTLRTTSMAGVPAELTPSPEAWLTDPGFLPRLVHPDDRAATLALWRQVASDGRERQSVHRVVVPGGTTRWFRTTVRRDGSDGPPRLAGLMQDVTALTATLATVREQALALKHVETLAAEKEHAARQLQAIIETMEDGVFVVDLEGRPLLSNDAALRLVGLTRLEEAEYTAAELTRRVQVRHPDGRPMLPPEQPLVRALEGEVVRDADVIVHNPRTERDVFLRMTAAPVRDEEGRTIAALGVIHDMTRNVEFDWLKAQFTSMVAHELKTPASIMKGYSQALLRWNDPLEPRQRAALEAIDRGATRIDKIVQELLDLTQLEQGRVAIPGKPVDLSPLVTDVVARMARAAPGHRIRVLRSEPAIVCGAPERLRYVLGVLLDNAIRYSPGGGDVDVEVTVRGTEAIVSVRDQGVGIPTEKQSRVFERFYRAHASGPHDYGGLGIGLHVARELIAKQHGRMGFSTEEGKGTTFSFVLPLVTVSARRAA